MKFNQNIYYKNENSEVITNKYKVKKIDENYKYIHKSLFHKIFSFVTYWLVAFPYAFIVFKILKNTKFHNKNLLQKYKKNGYFIYANHASQFGDGFCPGLICCPKKPHIIVNPINISIPIIGRFNGICGALPLPDNIKATKNFFDAINYTLEKNNPIVIYPEEHLWPYYTKIRNFSNSSFRYPIKFNKPVFTFTTIFKKKKIGKKPKIEIYVDGPFYPNSTLNAKEAQQDLRDTVFKTLSNRASLSNYNYVNYIKEE